MTATNQNFYLRVWEYFALALCKWEWDIGIMSTQTISAGRSSGRSATVS